MKQPRQLFNDLLKLGKNSIAPTSIFLLIFGLNDNSKQTESWMTYRHDNTRSGYTSAQLTPPLSLHWTFHPTHPPRQAWPAPGEEMARMHVDNAYHVTAAEGKVFFGSSVDNKVYALNAKTGKIKWTFFTEGPVRYAPTIWEDRIFVGSDDGYVYCLKMNNGKLIWKYRAGPGDEKVLGNGRMISLWPVRTSLLADKGIVYFGAGVFPYEGIYICALNARDGSIVWKNDTMGDRAHELAFGGISPQSYLIASENTLYVPSGRAMPAAFDIKTGEFLYYCLPGAKVGGTWTILDGEKLIAGVDLSGTPAKVTYAEKTGEKIEDVHAWFPGTDLIVTPDVAYTLTEKGIFAMDRTQYQAALEKVITLNEERQELRGKLHDLEVKLEETKEDTTEEALKKMNQEKDDLIQQIDALTERADSLKNSVRKWEYDIKNMNTLILAGDKIFTGGKGVISAVDAPTGEELWKSEIKGKALGFAATDGRLYVSTDNGSIYCFEENKKSKSKDIQTDMNPEPYKKDRRSSLYESAAETIIEKTGVKEGYCLVLDCGTGQLAFELARRTDLKIIGIERDPKKVKKAKDLLDRAGLYGSRIVVEPWDLSALPDYFANLIVSDKIMISGKIQGSPEEIFRVLKPYGGVVCFGQPADAAKRGSSLKIQNLLPWMKKFDGSEPDVMKCNGLWATIIRGELKGAGSWTEQYGNPQNTACSGDELVKGPLGILWYGEPGSEKILDRHSKAASPVSLDGRLFIQGEEVIMAYDAFNGTQLWEKEIPGAIRARADVDGGNLKVTGDGLYVAAHDKCYRLNPATGETRIVFETPAASTDSTYRWTYVSFTDNILLGARGKPLNRDFFDFYDLLVENEEWKNDTTAIPPKYRDYYRNLVEQYPVPDERVWLDFKRSGNPWRAMADFPVWELYRPSKDALTENMMSSDKIFAMNPETGEIIWEHEGRRIAHITITSGDGCLFFTESDISAQQKERAISDRKKLTQEGSYELSNEGKIAEEDIDARIVIALDVATGKKLWERPLDLTGCGGDGVATAYHDGVLLFFGSSGTHDAWRFQNASLTWRRLTALSAKNGDVLWSRPINYNARPVIVGNRIFIEPRACDLHTGEIMMRSHPITGEQVPFEYLRPGHTCAVTSASANMLFYRSSSTAIYDFEKDRGLTLFGSIRPSCWINMIPANGVLLFPEGSAGCTCSFPLRCSVVLKHKENRSQPYTVFITHGAMTMAKHFAINLGAPADIKDEDGNVWFGYPNPKTEYLQNHYPNYGVKFDLQDTVLSGMGYFCSDFKNTTIEGSNRPYLFSSGCLGLIQCKIPLIDDIFGEEPGVYTVRLGFSAPSGDKLGQRVFDITLQGNPVIENFDVRKDAGSPNKAVIKEWRGIPVENDLVVDLSSRNPNPTLREAPIINFIEVIKEEAAETSQARIAAEKISKENTDTLLRDAKLEIKNGNNERALNIYHTIIDAAASDSLKRLAMEGMAAIASPKSLGRLAKYCRDDSHVLTEPHREKIIKTYDTILWDYKGPGRKLRDSASRVFIAIANKTARDDKQMAIKMLKRALNFTEDEVRQEALSSLGDLGVEIIEEEEKKGDEKSTENENL